MQYERQRQQLGLQMFAKEQEEKRKKRDAIIDYTSTYNPEAKWEPMQDEVNQMANSIRDYTRMRLNQNVDAGQIQSELGQQYGMVINHNAELKMQKEKYNEANELITKDLKYNEDAKSALNDIFFKHNSVKPNSPDERRKNLGTIETDIIHNPKLFNEAVVAKKFMDNLPQQAQSVFGGQKRADGTYPSSQEVEGKLPYQRDAKGLVMTDPTTQKPLMKMTDDLYTLAMGDKDLRLLMQDRGGEKRADQEAYLQKILPMFDKTKIDNKVFAAQKLTEGERTAGETARTISERFKNNEAIVTGFRPDLLANTFDPYKSHAVEYVNKAGKVLVSYDEKNKTYTTADGQILASGEGPTKIRVSFTKGGLAEDMATLHANADLEAGRITKTEYDAKMKDLATLRGKLDTRDFDITTKQGKRAAHHVLNRLLDEFLPPKERQAEGYTKQVNDFYDASTGGVY